ncbi:MAG: hemerythrin domain-containing protein [Thermoplasmata archaeon]|nr:hemerythrin domain-containing protein [Thermoplasmata archaeon]
MGYDPIDVLMEEHQIFLRRLERARADLSPYPHRSERGGLGAVAVSSFAEFLAKDVESIHGRKEEEGLFPVLVRHIGAEGGPVEVMVSEHEELRNHQRRVAANVPKLEQDPSAVEAWTEVSATMGAVDRLLRFHIEKEDQVLFPMARSVLSPQELVDIGEICQEIEARAGGGILRPEL